MSSPPTARVRVLAIATLAIVALLLLAASVSELEFSEGYRRPPPPSSGGLLSALPDNLLDALIAALLLIAPILMLVGALVGLYASGFRAKALLWFLWVSLLVFGLYLALRAYPAIFDRFSRPEAPSGLVVVTPAITPGLVEEMEEFDATPPAWAGPVAAAGIAFFVALGIVAAAWVLVGRLSRRPSPVDDLAGEAQRALDALRSGADVRDSVMRCYFDMGRVLDEHYGLVRKEAMTPREFEQLLAGVDLARDHVERLTRLFEMVRYGSRIATDTQEREAIACLAAIAGTRKPGSPAPVESRL